MLELDDLINIEKLKILNKYSIEFGILTEDGVKTQKVEVLNSDDTTSTIDMKIADIMYFTENGTLTLPGKYIFEKSLHQINELTNKTLNDVISKIIEYDISDSEIENIFRELTIKIESYVKGLMISTIKNTDVLGSLSGQKDQNKYLYDLTSLSKYIKCRLIVN